MNQTSTIYSVDTGFIYAVFKLSFSKQYKIKCFNPLYQLQYVHTKCLIEPKITSLS